MKQAIKKDNYLEENRNSVTASKLKYFLENPEAYKLRYIDEIPVEEEEKKYFIIGTALHDMAGYGKEFFSEKYFAQEKRLLKKDLQVELAKLGLETDGTVDELETRLLNGRIKLTAGDIKTILGMYGELLRQPLADMNGNYKKEELIEVNFEGLNLRGRLDRIDLENKVIRDYKTCASITKLQQDMQWGRINYIFQVSFYWLLAKIKYGIECDVIIDMIDKSKNTCYLGIKFTNEQIKAQLPIIEKAIDDLVAENKKLENGEECFKGVDSDLRNETFDSDYYKIMDCSIQKEFEYIEEK